MLQTFELFVAARYLKAKRRQSVISLITVISVLGVAAGVMALVIALAVNNGSPFSLLLQVPSKLGLGGPLPWVLVPPLAWLPLLSSGELGLGGYVRARILRRVETEDSHSWRTVVLRRDTFSSWKATVKREALLVLRF